MRNLFRSIVAYFKALKLLHEHINKYMRLPAESLNTAAYRADRDRIKAALGIE